MKNKHVVQLGEPLFVALNPFAKGGAGSGNFGHSGRPGVRGGSGGGSTGGGGMSISRINDAKGELASVAQKVYDDWEQDEEGMDDVLGSGGICQDIAAGISDKLSNMGYEATTVSAQVGEQHVWTVVKTDDGVYEVDIPPGVYETGGGYNWKKIKGVKIDASDVYIDRLSPDPDDFEQYTEEF